MDPLTTWTCDRCHQEIERPTDGYVIWNRETPSRKQGNFTIIHQSQCDEPRRKTKEFPLSLALTDFMGPMGQARLLSWLAEGPLMSDLDERELSDVDNVAEFVNFFRRVQTPFYEQARARWSEAKAQGMFADATEYLPYAPESLEQIAALEPQD